MMAMSLFQRVLGPVRLRTLRPIAVSALLFSHLGCGGGDAPPAGAPPPGAMAVPVEMVTVAEQPLEVVGEFVGTIKSRRTTTIQPQAEGFLLRILVKSGDRVSVGTPMFEIDAGPLRAAIAAMDSQRAAREADAKWARQQAERTKQLLAAGAASQQEYDQALAGLQAAEAQLKSFDEQIRQQRTQLAYARVLSPTVGSRWRRAGAPGR